MIRTALVTLAACTAMVQGITHDGVLARVGLSLSTANDHTGNVTFTGSNYVKVRISQLSLGEGDVLVVSDEDRTEVQEFTEADMEPEYGGVWALTVYGDKALIEVRQTKENAAAQKVASATIEEAFHGIRDFGDENVNADEEGNVHSRDFSVLADIPSGCSVASKPIACEKGRYGTQFNRANAVARLNLGGSVCTAWRAGTKPDTMITNNHCIGSQNAARRAQVEFDYQDSGCRRGNARSRRVVVRVAEMLMTDKSLDLTVFRVQDASRIARFGSFEVDSNSPRRGDDLYIAGHPAGRPKELSQCRATWVNTQRRNMVGFDCSPEGGSSGSPIISKATNKAVGLLCHGYGRQCGGFGAKSDKIYEKVVNIIGRGGSNGGGGSQPPPRPPTPPTPPRRTPAPWQRPPSRTPTPWQRPPSRTPSPNLWWCPASRQACGECYSSEYWARWARQQCNQGPPPAPRPPSPRPRPPSPRPRPPSNGCRSRIQRWGNCHRSPRCCQSGTQCRRRNRWYSQCL